jgi:hypothetical protein
MAIPVGIGDLLTSHKKNALFSIPEIKCFIVNVILGLDLYLKLPFGKLYFRNPTLQS